MTTRTTLLLSKKLPTGRIFSNRSRNLARYFKKNLFFRGVRELTVISGRILVCVIFL